MLEFNAHASGGVTVNSASSMLSMLNMEASRHQNFLLGSPPLAALHSMAEPRKSSCGSPSQCSPPPASSLGKPQACKSSLATPHGINDILCRPVMTTAGAGLGSLHGALPRFGSGMYFNPSGVHHKLGLGDLQGRPHLYWPSVVQNQALWRERLASANLAQNCLLDKDGKKKQTRPTFSGHQIYVLEKTFEQTKYLAGPERAKLAYGLGMSEGQVKVWFQNRRTKWRKKHAAEMATAKKKHDSQSALHEDQVLLHGDPRGHREEDNAGSDQDDLDVLCKDYGGSRGEDSNSPMSMV